MSRSLCDAVESTIRLRSDGGEPDDDNDANRNANGGGYDELLADVDELTVHAGKSNHQSI